MTTKTQSCEGTASGTAITLANSATGGDALQTITTSGSGQTFEFSTIQAAHGSSSWHIQCPASTSIYGRWTGFNSSQIVGRFYIYFVALSASAGALLEIRDTSSAVAAQLVIGSGSQFYFAPKSGTGTSVGTALSTGTWYRVEMQLDRTAGTAKVQTYSLDSGTVIASVNLTSQDLGTVNFAGFFWGRTSAPANVFEAYYDDIKVVDGTATAIGPVAANVAPTASAGTAQYVVAGTSVTLAGTDSDSDGTVASRQWVCTAYPAGATNPTLTGATTASCSFTAATAGVYTFSYQVTDNAGATSTLSYVSTYVYPASGSDITVKSVVLGSWTKTGSASTTEAGLNDALVDTGASSPVNPSNAVITLLLNPAGPGALKFYPSGYWVDGAISRTVTLYKEDGTTAVGEPWTQTLTNTNAEVEFKLSDSGLAAIPQLSDRRALVVKLVSSVV